MTTPLTPITTFAESVAAGRPEQFEDAVRAAYEAGADRDTLLMAVDVAGGGARVPAAIAGQAYAAVHRWQWIAARRARPRQKPMMQAA